MALLDEKPNYLNALEKAFDFSIIESFLSLGTADPGLIEAVRAKHSHTNASSAKADEVQHAVFDLVSCTLSIQDAASQTWASKLAGMVKHTLVINFPNGYTEKPDLVENLQKFGLNYWPEVSATLEKHLGADCPLLVFKKITFLPISSAYYIQQINTSNASHEKYLLKGGLYKDSLQQAFVDLGRRILELSKLKKSASILRASDGDYFFIRKIAIGSAKPGRRALTKDYDSVNIPLFRQLFWQNDIISVSIEKAPFRDWKKFLFYEWADPLLWKMKFKIKGHSGFKIVQHFLDPILSPVIANRWFLYLVSAFSAKFRPAGYWEKSREIINKSYVPMEAVYALVANKWIFRNFKNQIGLIGGGPKLELVKLLMAQKEYREYIGMDSFTEYVEIPQIGAADDITALAKSLEPQIKNSTAKIFLVATGSSKIGLMPLLKAYSNAIFIDVGCGVDALAGVVLQTRPYFADWTNYRLKSYDYGKVDFMDQGSPEWNNENYKTIWLES